MVKHTHHCSLVTERRSCRPLFNIFLFTSSACVTVQSVLKGIPFASQWARYMWQSSEKLGRLAAARVRHRRSIQNIKKCDAKDESVHPLLRTCLRFQINSTHPCQPLMIACRAGRARAISMERDSESCCDPRAPVETPRVSSVDRDCW